MKYTYSPHPIDDYIVSDVTLCEAGWIKKSGNTAYWNLFWLANPDVDTLPGNKQWWKTYQPMVDLLHSVVLDVKHDKRVETRLLGHPLTFRVWFEDVDIHSYRLTGLLGPCWRDRVLHRADLAAARFPMTYGQSCSVLPLRGKS